MPPSEIRNTSLAAGSQAASDSHAFAGELGDNCSAQIAASGARTAKTTRTMLERKVPANADLGLAEADWVEFRFHAACYPMPLHIWLI